MRIILSDFISLDGVVQAPGGSEEDTDGGFRHGGWSMPFFDEDMGAAIDEVMGGTEALLFGRRTWEVMAGAWPQQAGDPFADQMNAIPKYVVSETLTAEGAASRWHNTTLLGGQDAMAEVRRLREQDGNGGILVWGSASLARQLVDDDLVDEYRLMIEPILLGGGKTIFPSSGRSRPLELISVQQAATGVLICAYRRAPA